MLEDTAAKMEVMNRHLETIIELLVIQNSILVEGTGN